MRTIQRVLIVIGIILCLNSCKKQLRIDPSNEHYSSTDSIIIVHRDTTPMGIDYDLYPDEYAIPDDRNFHDSLIIPTDIRTFTRSTGSTYWIPKDTVTKNRNYVRYLLTKDSCCWDNIYIQWGNDTVKRIEIAQSVRQFRTYFTPEFISETKDYLIFEHGCATSCAAVLFLPLNNYEEVHSVLDIVKYDPVTYTVVAGLSNGDDEREFLEAINIKTGKKKRIIFKYLGKAAAEKTSLVDSCNISANEIYIRANLYDEKNDKDVVEILRLQNEIKP